MVSETPVSYIQCPSCLRRNHSDMQFCIYCGAGVTPEAERKRTLNPLTWRTCVRCGQTDELNQNFCIFCSGKIVVPGTENQQNSNAFRKFSWELEQIDHAKMPEKHEEPRVQQPPVKYKVKRNSGNRNLGVTVFLALLGVAAGAGLSFLVGQTGLERVVLQSTTWKNKDLVVYTTEPNADIAIHDETERVHILTKADPEGALSLSDLTPGKYFMTITSPKGAALVKFPVVESRTTVLGFPTRITPTKAK